ncbi:MAG TPA: tRNA 2-thiouridine(34) synthase MnmA, partial [Proteobacteria bacterium]|nr:tRNA 2-thiouridine(34) synthase MnmA [Pseudomonadota bacterium]
ELTKDEVRRIATDREMPASRRESQDVCFLVGGDYREFLEKRLDEPPRAGQIVDLRGRVRGLHSGYYRYTIGQRHGIGIRSRRPFYVVDIVPEANRVVVGRLRDLYKKKVVAHGLNMLEDVGTRFRALVQVRARMQPTEADITVEGDRAIIEFQSPVRAPARGQAAVFYDGNLVLGGGWIESTE